MKQLVEDIAKALVDIPEEVSVRVVEGEQVTVLELRVAPSDLGKVIGKQGRTAQVHPYHFGSGRDEVEPPLHAGNPGVSLSGPDDPCWVAVALAWENTREPGRGYRSGAQRQARALPGSQGSVSVSRGRARRAPGGGVDVVPPGISGFQVPGSGYASRTPSVWWARKCASRSPSARRSIRASSFNRSWWVARWWTGEPARAWGASKAGRIRAARACWRSKVVC